MDLGLNINFIYMYYREMIRIKITVKQPISRIAAIIEIKKNSFHVIQLSSFFVSRANSWLDYFGSQEYGVKHNRNKWRKESITQGDMIILIFVVFSLFWKSVNEWMTYAIVTVSNLLNWSFVTFPLILIEGSYFYTFQIVSSIK